MKIASLIFVFLLVLYSAGMSNPIDVEVFKKKSLTDQAKDIAIAPPEQQEELVRIHRHSERLVNWGGETGIRWVKEALASQDKGVWSLDSLFQLQLKLWEDYYSATDMTYRQAGQLTDDAIAVLKRMDGERQALIRQRDKAHELAFHVAASPEALELAGKAEILEQELSDKYGLMGTPAKEPINKVKMGEIETQIEQIYAKMKTLPTLRPEELQKEYDAVSEERVPTGK